jgi:hypothetical protein
MESAMEIASQPEARPEVQVHLAKGPFCLPPGIRSGGHDFARSYTVLLGAISLVTSLTLVGCASRESVREEMTRSIKEALKANTFSFPTPQGTKLDSLAIAESTHVVTLSLSKEFSYIPLREGSVDSVYGGVRRLFGNDFADYRFNIRTLQEPIEQLIPNFYRRSTGERDFNRIPKNRSTQKQPLVQNISAGVVPSKGLFNRNIVLWHSHGWYYDNLSGRWQWQRPRLFQSVEDLGPLSFTLPYLIPMLENAGARVFVPRERDPQTHEVVVDNDTPGSGYAEIVDKGLPTWRTDSGTGFAQGTPPYPVNFNVFAKGTHRVVVADSRGSAKAQWIPAIPGAGNYAVYISWAMSDSNVTDAMYTVYHAGGRTEFRVNQQAGGGTWQYLGTFMFRSGTHPDSGCVMLTNKSTQTGRLVTADGVRFGGGMGVVERGGATSGRPKFMEAARYYLQYAGMPDTLVYSLNTNENEYKDDYQSRGEYVNFLTGSPYGPNRDRAAKGLGIPIDVSLAFHTDAGITHNDTTVGTLSIYSIQGNDSTRSYPDSTSRLANRDLADILQSQIVNDIRSLHDPLWNRRQLRDALYAEAVRPNVPSVLLELLSHQNPLDMRFMLDPRFRFDVARAIYKSILRFLSVPDNPACVVQPLPVTHFSTALDDRGNVTLRWKPASDPLEASAQPDRYTVYTRKGDGGFDNGRIVTTPECIIREITPGVVYGFQVRAVNEGGEGFPSEILSLCYLANGKRPALIVNGFDRVCGPAYRESPAFAGFLNLADAGVPDRRDFNFTGQQYDFDPTSEFRSNDAPGHGASFADDETRLIAGNTFDFPYIHGMSLLRAGYSFVSCSDEAVTDGIIDLSPYRFVDLILGEEKETRWVRPAIDSLRGRQFQAFPVALQEALRRYTTAGGNLFISGSYVGTELFVRTPADSNGMRFAKEILKYSWGTDHASRTGVVIPTKNSPFKTGGPIQFNTSLRDDIYQVEAPDAIWPHAGSSLLLRYEENQFGAAIGYRGSYGVVVCGFPFETILGEKQRDSFMKEVLTYLGL